MSLSIIVAHDKNRGIGFKTKIPWFLPNDFSWFKRNTKGKTVIMGTTTYFSLPDKFRPLPNRENIVLCNRFDLYDKITEEGAEIFKSIKEAVDYSKDKDVFIIGGASVYTQFIDMADKLYITRIDNVFECDTFFPEVDFNEWEQTYKSEVFTFNGNDYTFNIYDKK